MFTAKRVTDTTALERQNRRLQRLKTQGVTRSTVFVHEQCKLALDTLRPILTNPAKANSLTELVLRLEEKSTPTNVAQVKQLSPFRYPGGKTWLVPEIRNWLRSARRMPDVFVEPFAGGAMAGPCTGRGALPCTPLPLFRAELFPPSPILRPPLSRFFRP